MPVGAARHRSEHKTDGGGESPALSASASAVKLTGSKHKTASHCCVCIRMEQYMLHAQTWRKQIQVQVMSKQLWALDLNALLRAQKHCVGQRSRGSILEVCPKQRSGHLPTPPHSSEIRQMCRCLTVVLTLQNMLQALLPDLLALQRSLQLPQAGKVQLDCLPPADKAPHLGTAGVWGGRTMHSHISQNLTHLQTQCKAEWCSHCVTSACRLNSVPVGERKPGHSACAQCCGQCMVLHL